jgi:glycosyltransferase involved in cell wall biosynthesis/MoaA/NifB/PqqE/SkfB family radical SAM enzyme
LGHAALPASVAAFWNRVPLHYDWDDWEAQIYADAVGSKDSHWRRIHRFEVAMAKIADTVSVASAALRDQALALGVREADLFDAPVGADLSRFRAGGDGERLRREFGFDGPVAMYLGQLAGAHAAPLFLDAAALVLEQVPDARFLVVGGGRTLEDTKQHAARLGIADRVHFTGAVSHDAVADHLDVADVAVATLPNTAQAATKSPLKIVEYMAAGKAIVASRVGEAVRFLDGGKVGRLAAPGDAGALAESITELLADPYLRDELGVSARERLRDAFTWNHTADRIEQAWFRARAKRGLHVHGRTPSRGPGADGAREVPGASALPQAGIAPPPPPPLNGATVKRLRRATPGRLREALAGRLDMAGVFHGEAAFTGPYTIQLDVTNRCNNDCIACWLHSPLLRKTGPNAKDLRAQLRFDVVARLLDDAAAMGTRDIYMAGGGDPIVYPWLRETVERAKSHGMTVAINTNFALANDDWCDWACDVGLDDITISVWAGSPETYDATHPNKKPEDYEKLKKQVTYLNRRKREVGRGPTVKVYHVVSNLNAHEFDAMYGFVEETGSEAVEFTVVDTVPGKTDVLLFDEASRAALLEKSLALQRRLEASGEADRLFGYDHWLRRLRTEDVVDGRGDSSIVHTFPCTIGWTFLRVMPDGKVASCLKSHRIPIGNINEQGLPKIWNNHKQREFRRKTNVLKKRDAWFSNIGNDPDAACGCEKSCDDLGRNLAMNDRLKTLGRHEKALLEHSAGALTPL